MILLGIKRTAALALMGLGLTACVAPLPGGETGPFAPGNTVTYYYQSVLTDPPEQASIISCDDGLLKRTCIQLSNAAVFPLQPTETGVTYGNEEIQVILQLDEGDLPSGVGQVTNTVSGDVLTMRWVSLPS